VEVEEFEALLGEGFVEVDEEGAGALVEGAKIVLEVLEEGGVVVAGLDGVPVLALPVGVGTDAHVLHKAMATLEGAAVDGDGEVERAVGGVDGAAVADGLLVVVLVLLNENRFVSEEGDEP